MKVYFSKRFLNKGGPGGIDWYFVKVGDQIKYRSPFFGPFLGKVTAKESSKMVTVLFDGEKYPRPLVTNHLTLEQINGKSEVK